MPDDIITGNNDDFDKFFDDIASGKTPAATPETPVVAVTPAAETPVVAETPVTPVVAETPVTPVVAETPVVETPAEPTTREVLEKFMETMSKRPEPVAPVAKPVTPQPAPVWNDAELATLTQFEKDYPDMAKAMGIMLRGALVQNNANTFDQISRVIAPAMSNVDAIADAHALTELRRLIPDYDTVRDPVLKWVAESTTLPAYLRRAYVSVIDEGEARDIADVVGAWRQATGAKAPVAVPAKKANELSEAAKQAAETLAPVITQRTVTSPGDPQTYDDAFEAAAAIFAKAS